MQTQTPGFHVWSDGSFHVTGQSGSGAVFTDGLQETVFAAYRIPTTHLPIENSIHAEFVAATQALQLARHFAAISGMTIERFHSDNDAVLKLLRDGQEPADACSRPQLKRFCEDLRHAFDACKNPAVEYASDKKQAPMKMAHNLAQSASGIQFEDCYTMVNAIFDATPETSGHSTGGTHGCRVPPDVPSTPNAP